MMGFFAQNQSLTVLGPDTPGNSEIPWMTPNNLNAAKLKIYYSGVKKVALLSIQNAGWDLKKMAAACAILFALLATLTLGYHARNHVLNYPK